MTDRPDDQEANDGEGFAARWSRRKVAERARIEDQETTPLKEAGGDDENVPAKTDAEAPVEIAPEDLPDIETLDKDSDYTPFMQDGVPEWLRRVALHKLWLSDPLLANLDGLNDYDEDFSAIGTVAREITSRYKPGSGMPDDDHPDISAEESGQTAEPDAANDDAIESEVAADDEAEDDDGNPDAPSDAAREETDDADDPPDPAGTTS
jgi:hypothetical protein